ncbi:hypothetical protein CRG98_009603 [Punica granatum]|uniref:Uncharacterized protein n=1 Tax=Punica granatum TaxID=22663 RepID=A0A2I0KNU5_PUNGR|nr:hypothetical protein CRG98_009603 [Punica granatum]
MTAAVSGYYLKCNALRFNRNTEFKVIISRSIEFCVKYVSKRVRRDRGCTGKEHLYVEQENIDSQGYNTKLEDLVSRLNSQHSGIHIEYVDIYNPMAELLEDPKRFDKIIV